MTSKSGKEIERKFLLSELPSGNVLNAKDCDCAYYQTFYIYNSDPELRLRAITEYKRGSLDPLPIDFSMAVKFGSGLARDEFLNEIPDVLFWEHGDCTKYPFIFKLRFKKSFGGLLWEIDNFSEPPKLRRLYMAEVELSDAKQDVQIPDWLPVEKEVTDDTRYSNKNLAVSGIPNPR